LLLDDPEVFSEQPDEVFSINKESSFYGDKINKIFPLLDPDLKDDDERELKHRTWF
jgi:hypothetical protein